MTGKIDRHPDWDFNKILDWWIDNRYGDDNPTTIYAYESSDPDVVMESKECVSFDQVVSFIIEHNTPGKNREVRYDHDIEVI